MKRPGAPHPGSPEPVQADLAGALHEVSNTLTVVLGWLDAAKNQAHEGNVQDAIDVALSHARLGHAIARRAIGADVEDTHVTRSALSIAGDAVLGVAQEALRQGVKVEAHDCAEEDLLLVAAPVAQQILVNLLLNAVHFSPRGTDVALVVETCGAQMRFRVVDRGPGIAPERVATLFESPDSTRPGGAGIGLRHAHALAEQHGGCLGLASTGPTGSVFELTWPMGEAPSRAIRTIPPPSLDGVRVLLLEDDPAVQALVDLGLTTRGATVAPVSTLAELSASLGQGVFDVALLDLSPLGKDPEATLRLITEKRPGLPVVVISGSVAPDVDSPCIAAWVRKPFEIGELVDVLTRIPRG
ncbi:MAG TPA: ATP-binding protein [Polyangiaceae bacterium]|nr:ATP-binding protein [Polyangiaceae bacterium]